MRKSIITIGAIYLSIGILFYFSQISNEFKTYECKSINDSNGYYTIFVNSFTPPSKNCSRRGLTSKQLIGATPLIPFWLPYVILKSDVFWEAYYNFL